MNQKITRHKSAADDLEQQSQVFPHHRQDLFSPGQKHHAAVPEAPERGPLHPLHPHLSVSRILILVPRCVFAVVIYRLIFDACYRHLPKYVSVNSERKLLSST